MVLFGGFFDDSCAVPMASFIFFVGQQIRVGFQHGSRNGIFHKQYKLLVFLREGYMYTSMLFWTKYARLNGIVKQIAQKIAQINGMLKMNL